MPGIRVWIIGDSYTVPPSRDYPDTSTMMSIGFGGVTLALPYDGAQIAELAEMVAALSVRDIRDKETIEFRACYPKSWLVPDDKPDDDEAVCTERALKRRRVWHATDKAWTLFYNAKIYGRRGSWGIGAFSDFCLPE